MDQQHLRIKAFYGTSENAVKTQIWTAVSVYVLVGIKKRLGLGPQFHQILRSERDAVRENPPGLSDIDSKDPHPSISNQLILRFILTMHDGIVGVTLKPQLRIALRQPPIKGVVQEQIG